MREATKEEQDGINRYIESISTTMIPLSVIEDIKAEIEHVIDNTYDSTDYDKSLYNGAYKDGLYEALDLIDKHISKKENS